jgi:hypothetical protein
VVEILVTGGRINVFGSKYIGAIGVEDVGYTVIIPWQSGWWYYFIGALEVRYIVRKHLS